MVKVISCPQCGQRLCKAEAGTNIVEVMCPKCKAIFAGKVDENGGVHALPIDATSSTLK